MTETAVIRDVTEAGFAVDVIEASRTRPVVVDFWASWCGPCRQLSPLLEQAAARWAGEVDVVKVDTDRAPGLVQQLHIQGIPAVKAFVGGRLVAEFVGLQPQASIDRFFGALAPSEADRLVAAASERDPVGAEPLLRQALERQKDHPGALRGLAQLLSARGEGQQAAALLQRLPGDPEAARLLAELKLAEGARDQDALAALRARADGGDPSARVELGRALAAEGDHAAALAELLTAVREPAARDDARTAMLEIFRVLGEGDELVRQYRPRLAAVLF